MELKFRKLNADEIDVRVATVKENGVSLLLYKDARVDQNLLDETVGQFSWQRDHKELKGVIYCGIGIYNEKTNQWVWKWDAGSESFADKEKGEASDSFKRAGFNWGIGRELYTSPFIWVNKENVNIISKGNGFTTYDTFRVKEITYDLSGNIKDLTIVNEKSNKVVFSSKTFNVAPKESVKKAVTSEQIEKMKELGVNFEGVIKTYRVENIESLDYDTAEYIIKAKSKVRQKEIDVTAQAKTLKPLGDK
jgi:hypothetical protein